MSNNRYMCYLVYSVEFRSISVHTNLRFKEYTTTFTDIETNKILKYVLF